MLLVLKVLCKIKDWGKIEGVVDEAICFWRTSLYKVKAGTIRHRISILCTLF